MFICTFNNHYLPLIIPSVNYAFTNCHGHISYILGSRRTEQEQGQLTLLCSTLSQCHVLCSAEGREGAAVSASQGCGGVQVYNIPHQGWNALHNIYEDISQSFLFEIGKYTQKYPQNFVTEPHTHNTPSIIYRHYCPHYCIIYIALNRQEYKSNRELLHEQIYCMLWRDEQTTLRIGGGFSLKLHFVTKY